MSEGITSMKRRALVFGLVALGLSACAGPAPRGAAIPAELSAQLTVSSVAIDISEMGETTTGRQVPASAVKAILQREANALLVGQGSGSTRAQVNMAVTEVSLITGAQSFLIGGESIMRATVSVTDARTGETLLPATQLTSGGGGWVAGGLIAVATQEDADTELRQLSQEMSSRARILLFDQ